MKKTDTQKTMHFNNLRITLASFLREKLNFNLVFVENIPSTIVRSLYVAFIEFLVFILKLCPT